MHRHREPARPGPAAAAGGRNGQSRTPLPAHPRCARRPGNGVLAIDHTDHQGHQVILFGGRIHGQTCQRLLRQLPPARGHPPAAHPLQQRGEAASTSSSWSGTPGVNAIRIVIQQLPLQAAQRVRVAGTPEAVRQRQGHRILTAVQAPAACPPPTGPAPPVGGWAAAAAALSTGGGYHTMQQVDAWPHSGAVVFVRVTLSLPAGHASA